VNLADLWLPFLTGFFGGGHCIGMCGGFVLALELRPRSGGRSLIPHLLYNAGRIATYGILGAVFGAVGSFAGAAGVLGHWRAGVLFFAGLFMLALALNILGLFGKPWEFPAAVASGGFGRLVRSLMHGGAGSAFPLGLVMGLIPCGLVYTMLLAAATAGDAPAGALRMLVFGAGTLPAMLGLGALSSVISPSSRLALYRTGPPTPPPANATGWYDCHRTRHVGVT